MKQAAIAVAKTVLALPMVACCLIVLIVGGLFYGLVSMVREDQGVPLACTFALAVCLLGAGGCANIMVTRNPFEKERIEHVYQGTGMSAGVALIVAFPQMMSDAPSIHGFDPLNIFTIPLGCLVLVDTVCEAAIDTVCLPYDIPVSIARANAEKRWREKERERMRQSVTQSGTTHDGTEK